MANEWTKVELYGANNDGCPRRYAIASDVSVSKGQLLTLVDPRTASFAIAGEGVFAGVASMEKLASENSNSISLWTDGIFDAVASDAVVIGQPLTGALLNKVNKALLVASGANVLGYALEAGDAGERINVRLRL